MSFDVAAEAYDRFMGRYSILLAPQMVRFSGVRDGQRVLDVGCGPGALTTVLATRLGPESVWAVDPSEPFVAAARQRNPGVTVLHAPAEQLPFDDDAFDVAFAQLVVHFMADPVAGLAEMARVTRPSGVVTACVWDHAGLNGPLSVFWQAVRRLDPTVADESHLAGVREGSLIELMEAAGLSQAEQAVLVADREYAGFEDWWQPFEHGVGPAGAYVANLPVEQRTELRETCRAMLPNGGFVIPARAWAVRAVVQASASTGQ